MFSALGLLFFVLLFSGNNISNVKAAIPEVINYQGRLKDTSNVPLSGQYDFRFRLYTDSGATTLVWGPQEFSDLLVTNGYFSAQLGPFGLDFEDQYYLTIQVKEHSAGTWDEEATPAVPFATTPYAFKAKSLYAENEDISLQTTIAGNILMQPAGNVQIATNTDSAAIIINQIGSGDLLNAQSNGSTQFVIDENGNVGVGTASPNYAMEVYGDINVSGGSYLLNGVPLASVGAGTATGNTLIWDGSGWVENTNINTSSDGNLDIAGILQAGSSNVNLTLASGMIDPNALALNNTNIIVNGSNQLDTTQDINIASSPTFADLTLSNQTTAGIVKNDASGHLIGGQTIAASEVASSGIIEGTGMSLGGDLNNRILGSGSDLTISVGATVPTSVVSDTNIAGSITTNVLTLAWQGILGIDRGGTANDSYTLDEVLIYNGTSLVSGGATISDLSAVGSHTHLKSEITDFTESDYVHTTGDETISGVKSFVGNIGVSGNLYDGMSSAGSSGDYLISTGTGVEWASFSMPSNIFVQGGNTFGEAGVLGTVDDNELRIITNNSERLRVSASGIISAGPNPGEEIFVVDSDNDVVTIGDGTGWNHNSYIDVDDNASIITVESDDIALYARQNFNLSINAVATSALITDNRLAAAGLQYADDYSTSYTDRSLVDKAYVEGLLSSIDSMPSGSSLGETIYYDGTSWLATGNLYNNGTNIGIGTATDPDRPLVVASSGAYAGTAQLVGDAPRIEWYSASSATGSRAFDAVAYNDALHFRILEDDFMNATQDIFSATTSGITFNDNLTDYNFTINSLARNNSFFMDGTSGYVGIGTNTPSNPLQVVGAITISNIAPVSTDDALYNIDGHLYWNGIDLLAGTSKWSLVDAGPDIYHGNGNVGIGVDSPMASLHIRNESTGDQQIAQIDNNNSVYQALYIPEASNILVWDFNLTGDGGGIRFDNDSNPVALITAQGLIVNGDGDNYARIRVGGVTDSYLLYSDPVNDFIGVGTDSPTNKLSVNGAITIFDTTPDDTTNALYNIGGTLYWNGTELGGGGESLWSLIGTGPDIHRSTGNVSVGSSSNPSSRLQIVNNNTGDKELLWLSNDDAANYRVYIADGTNDLIWDFNPWDDGGSIRYDNYGVEMVGISGQGLIVNDDQSTTARLKVEGVGEEYLLYTDPVNNRVGIGTDTISETLTVDGTGLVSGHMAIGGDASVDPNYWGTTQIMLAVMETLTDWSTDMGSGIYTSVVLDPSIASPYSVYGTLTDISTTADNSITIADMSASSGSVWHNSTSTVDTATGGYYSVVNMEAGDINDASALAATVGNNAAGVIDLAYGLTTDVYNYIGGSIGSAYGLHTGIRNMNAGTINNSYGLYVNSLQNGTGTVDMNYGIYIADQSSATDNYNLYSAGTAKNYFGGNVGIGTTSPVQLLDVNGNAQVRNHISIGPDAIVDQDVLSQTAHILSNAREIIVNTTDDIILGYYGNIMLNPDADFNASTIGMQSDVYTTYTNNFNISNLEGYQTNIYHPSNGQVATVRGVNANIINYYSGGMADVVAGQYTIDNQGSLISLASGLSVDVENTNSAAIAVLNGIKIALTNSGESAIDSYTGIRIDSPTILDTSSVGVAYGLYIANQENTGVLNGYNIYSEGTAKNYIGGSLGIGVTSPTYHLEVEGSIGLKTGSFNFIDEDSSDYLGIQIASNLAESTLYTLPTADGEQGETLTTDGSGQLSWSRSSTAKEITSTMIANMRNANTALGAYMVDYNYYPSCSSGTSGWYLTESELTEALDGYGGPSGYWDGNGGNTARAYYFCDTDTGDANNYNIVWRFTDMPESVTTTESQLDTIINAYYLEKAVTVDAKRAGDLYAALGDIGIDVGMTDIDSEENIWPYNAYRYVYYTNDAKDAFWGRWVARTHYSTMTSGVNGNLIASYLDDASRMTLNAAYSADDSGLGRRIWADRGAIEIYSSLSYLNNSTRNSGGLAIYQSAHTEDVDFVLSADDEAALKIDNTGNYGKGLYLYSNANTSSISTTADMGLAVLYAANTNYTLDVLRVVNYGTGDGLSIQQEAANSNVLTYKDSGVSHGLSSIADNDAFARQLELWSNAGGLRIDAITDGDETVSSAMQINAYLRDTADTTSNNSTSVGVLVMNGAQHNGSGAISSVANTGNLLTVKNNDATRLIVKGNGDVLADGTFSSNGIDLAEYFEAEEIVTTGGLVGLNPETGLVRNYRSGDTLIGVQSTNPAFIGGSGLNGNEANSVLVGLIGQFESIPDTIDDNGSIYTSDKEYIVGYRLTNGKILLNITNWSELARWQSELLASVEAIKTRLVAVETKTQNIQADDEGMILGGITRIDNLSVTLDTSILGKLTSNGGLTVASDAEFKGIIRTNDQISGRVTLVKNTTEISVERTWTEEPLSIQVTPTFNARAWIKDISKDGFTIVVDGVQTENKEIHWFAVFGPSQEELTTP